MEDQENAKKRFRDWVKTKVPDAEYMNICSGPQVPFSSRSGCSNLSFICAPLRECIQ